MNKPMAAIALCALVGAPLDSHAAGRATNFYVQQVRVDSSGKGYVRFDQALGNASPTSLLPECAKNPLNPHPSDLAFDVNTPGGKAVMSLAMLAKASNLRVTAVGTGACATYGTVEDWYYGWVAD